MHLWVAIMKAVNTPTHLSTEHAQQDGAGVKTGDPERAHPPQSGRKAAAIAVLAAAVVIAVMVGIIYLLLQNPPLTANIRDIVIIIAALVLIVMSVVSSLLLIILLYRLQALTQFLRSELVPILMDTQKAARTVYGTTVFLSKSIAQPTIKAAGFAARFQRMTQVIGRKLVMGAPCRRSKGA